MKIVLEDIGNQSLDDTISDIVGTIHAFPYASDLLASAALASIIASQALAEKEWGRAYARHEHFGKAYNKICEAVQEILKEAVIGVSL